MTYAQILLKKLKAKRVTKYRIAKVLNVSWRTVHNWEKDFSSPNQENYINLFELNESR